MNNYEYIESLDIELITSSMILSKAFEKSIISKKRSGHFLAKNVKGRRKTACKFFFQVL